MVLPRFIRIISSGFLNGLTASKCIIRSLKEKNPISRGKLNSFHTSIDVMLFSYLYRSAICNLGDVKYKLSRYVRLLKIRPDFSTFMLAYLGNCGAMSLRQLSLVIMDSIDPLGDPLHSSW
jgi:hypothetical protein